MNALAGTFSDAAQKGDIVFNCTHGTASIDALKAAGEKHLNGKILVDVANPLDFSNGMPPTLSVGNTDSLGEAIQRAFPGAKVVKALNTLNAALMTDPKSIGQGDHDLFICGNDAAAKKKVTELLTSFGWSETHIFDLGDISNARGTEALVTLWIRLMVKFQSPQFQWKIVR